MKEWKIHDMENDRKCTPQRMTEKSQWENDRMGNVHLENCRIITPRKMKEKAHLENEGIENV